MLPPVMDDPIDTGVNSNETAAAAEDGHAAVTWFGICTTILT